ncbi:hypothetical protein [Propionicicella superfundia]|uniref:hypothetical protein n=1 Tax=Propionicicella superfundia TaxID=348582 RepID=UPI0003FC7DEB|nr:hypothetical protein [Propionicicella superfundia]
MKARHRRTVSSIFLSGVLLLGPAAATAGATPSSPRSGNRTTAQALGDDIAAYAEANGRTPADVAEYTRGQEDFNVAAEEVRRADPRAYVTAVWDGPDSGRTAIYVTHASRKAAAKHRFRVVVTDAMSETERDALADRLIAKAVSVIPGVTTAGAEIDPLTERLTLTYSQSETAARSRATSVSAADVTSALRGVTGAENLKGIAVSSIDEQATQEYGSGGNGGGGACTAGFTAKRGSSPAITNTSHYGFPSLYDGARLSSRRQTSAAGGDVSSFLTSGGTLTNSMRYDWGKCRKIKHSWDPTVGNVVCHFGIASGQSCAKATATGYKQWFSDRGTAGQLVTVDKNISKSGDSGGPWFWSDRAHGIHMGTCSRWSIVVSCFTRIGALDGIGTKVYTG